MEDYIKDDILYCGKCNTPKQCIVKLNGNMRKVHCLCKCQAEKHKVEEKDKEIQTVKNRIESLRNRGISDQSLLNCTFENAVMTQELQKCKLYAQSFEKAQQDNIGLLFWGDTDGGKTYASACIANYLIEKGVSVIITSFSRLLAVSFEEREDAINRARNCELLIIDDLQAEYSSDFALSIMYYFIDERIKTNKPMIITTNLTLDEMKSKKGQLEYWRAYERILQKCVPMFFQKHNFRAREAEEKMKMAWNIIKI